MAHHLLKDALWAMSYLSDSDDNDPVEAPKLEPSSPTKMEDGGGGLSPISKGSDNDVLILTQNFIEEDSSDNSVDIFYDEKTSQVESFYEFPTVMANPDESFLNLTSCGSGSNSFVVVRNTKKPPSYESVIQTATEHNIFEQRTSEMKRFGATFSKKSDATGSNAVDLGTDKVKISWANDLPVFSSSFGAAFRMPSSGKAVLLRRVGKPPTYEQALLWHQSCQKEMKAASQSEDQCTKSSILVRQNSEDSEGSILSLTPPVSPMEEDCINSSQITKKEPNRRIDLRRNSLVISGQGGSDTCSARENTLKGLVEANDFNNLTVFSAEVFVCTRQALLPDPEFDQVSAIFYAVTNDGPKKDCYGIIAVDPHLRSNHGINFMQKCGSSFQGCSDLTIVETEMELLESLIKIVQESSPDILVGYETQRSSWGYLCRRATCMNFNLAAKLSRVPSSEKESKFGGPTGASDIDSELQISGRILLNVWRLMRSEVALTGYSFENVMHAVLKKRLPKYSHQFLTRCWSSHHTRWIVFEYFLKRALGTLEVLSKLDLIGRTAELAKLFGIQFLEVLTRGSQFRVESIMLRLVKAKNMVPVSPTIQQRARMRAPEYIPLVMEPESRLYNDPVIVLDFQSLYPSIIMAYNYCYSTCLGRIIDHMKTGPPNRPFEFGCTHLKVSPQRLAKLEEHITFSPGGIGFLKESVRKGVLPKMLQEILDTRVMVKNSMKLHNKQAKGNPEWAAKNVRLQKILHSRQLGLKLIANVTYGYTSANFSGRMPCIEVGDSVVSKGRETLERAISMIERSDHQGRWPGAKVVYGDTDSIFVLLPGKSKDEAFDIGEEMAKVITQDNPKPVKLKFEKVYMPCILQTKKRYVGYMYESRDQVKPVYDAKGIETVRRDGVPAVVKMLEKCLRILFETKDVSLVKAYVQSQLKKIAHGRISLQELTFAREYRGLNGYRPGACVPALELTRRFCKIDRMCVPNVGERVPYVIVYGEPGTPLIQSVRSPEEVLSQKWSSHRGQAASLRPNATYYITRVIIPALSRCLSLIGADVLSWYSEMPKVKPMPRLTSCDQELLQDGPKSKGVIPHYFVARQCPICLRRVQTSSSSLMKKGSPICPECEKNPNKVAQRLSAWIHIWDSRLTNADQFCRNCDFAFDACRSLDCPQMYLRTEAKYEADQVEAAHELLKRLEF